MDKYFNNSELLQNTLLHYFCDEILLKPINKKFSELNYEKYNTHIQPHGIFETYYENAKIKVRKTFKNGKKNGLCEEWYDSGELWVKCWYKNNKLHGLYKKWHDSGQLWVKCNYKNGNLNGSCEQFYEDGKLKNKTIYINNVEDNNINCVIL